MPGVTPACLEESHLIRSKPDLLEKTLFVLPPLCCYQPGKMKRLDESFETFQRRMVQVHREEIGLDFPEPEWDKGYFLLMDHRSGGVAKSRPWKIVKLTTKFTSGRAAERSTFPSLDVRDVRAAVGLVLRRRRFLRTH